MQGLSTLQKHLQAERTRLVRLSAAGRLGSSAEVYELVEEADAAFDALLSIVDRLFPYEVGRQKPEGERV